MSGRCHGRDGDLCLYRTRVARPEAASCARRRGAARCDVHEPPSDPVDLFNPYGTISTVHTIQGLVTTFLSIVIIAVIDVLLDRF